MIRLNLLPERRRRKAEVHRSSPQSPTGHALRAHLRIRADRALEFLPRVITLLASGLVVPLCVLVLVLSVQERRVRIRLQMLDRELESLKPDSSVAAELEKRFKEMTEKMGVLAELFDGRILWARKLNELSDLVPEKVWLTSLGLGRCEESVAQGSPSQESVRRRCLRLRGVSISSRGDRSDERKVTVEFMDRMRQDPSFFKDFERVEQQGSIQWGRMGDMDTMSFELACWFREKR